MLLHIRQLPKTPVGKDQKEAKLKEDKAGELGSIPGLGRSPGEAVATHSIILAWRIPQTEESLVGYNPRGRKESDTTERFSLTHSNY